MDDPFENKTPAKEVSKLIGHSSLPFANLLTTARKLATLENLLDKLLGPEFRGKFRCAGLNDGELLLLVFSATLASSLRMQTDELSRQLEELGVSGLKSIQIRTAPKIDPQ